jgi:4-hydroxythreonine-4-phosphate dehydrogenase
MGTIKVGISVGDINGIGAEVIMKSLEDARILTGMTPIVYGSSRLFSFYKKALDLPFNFQKIEDASEAKVGKVNLINITEDEIKINVGESNTAGGDFAFMSLEAATKDLAAGKIDVLVTAPINKKNIQSKDFDFPGHTEYLTKLANADGSLMFMIKDSLRVGVATNHIPVQEISKKLTKDIIALKISLMNASLTKDFGIVKPRIAVLGLNPHAGENGMLGSEESEIILPAIEQANREEILAFGPYAADGLFGSGQYAKFDGILAMYHDQGLIPFKAMAGGTGVNFTAGLPIIRTSPDHGTAYDIAGKNEASPESFRNAIYMACDVFNNRALNTEITANPLKVKRVDRHSRER